MITLHYELHYLLYKLISPTSWGTNIIILAVTPKILVFNESLSWAVKFF